MDKTSPVFENFENKMAAMRGKPKINRSTMKIGGGLGLEGRVANNEKKITVLKNIFKAQRQEIGEKITPKVNTLELSLNETSEILGVITEKLSLDMSQRLADQKALFDAQRKKNIADKKDAAESKLEEKKKSKIGSSIAKAVIKPFGNLFDNLLNLAGILSGGLLATNLIGNLNNEDFLGKLKNVFDWTEKNWKALAVGAGILGGILIGGAIASFISSIGVVIGIVTNPLFLLALGVIGLSKLGDKVLDKVIDYYEDDSDNTKNFVGNPPPGAPDGARPGDFYTDKNGQVWVKQATLLNSQGIPIKQSNGGWSPSKITPNAGRITSNPLVDDGKKYETRDLTSVYKQNILDDDTGVSLINFVNKNEELKKLIKEKNLKPSIIELPPIDLTTAKKNTIGKMSTNPATGLPDVNSMNFANPYMEIFPEIANFDDVVYS